VAVLLIDSVEGPTDQDAAIAGEAERAGCGVIIVANKWDLMKGRGVNYSKEFDENLRRRVKFLDYAPVLHLSAMTGERTPKLLEMIERVAKSRHTRVSTGALNRFVAEITATQPPVSQDRRAVRIMYASQTGAADVRDVHEHRDDVPFFLRAIPDQSPARVLRLHRHADPAAHPPPREVVNG
jgi:GTP-binding protein